MKIISFFVLLTFVHISCYSQKTKSDSLKKTCLQVANELSYYWKLDSLANNGFRRYTYQKFLESKPDKLYADVLLNKLGKPNEIRKTNKGTEYIYYYFDIKRMPKNFNAPYACFYIGFKFEGAGNYLTSIEEGDMDR